VYNKKVQIYNPNDLNPWFAAPIEQQLPLYPAMFVIPSGFVFYAGRGTQDAPFKKTLALRLSDFTWHDVTLVFDAGGIGEHNSACSFSPGNVAAETSQRAIPLPARSRLSLTSAIGRSISPPPGRASAQ